MVLGYFLFVLVTLATVKLLITMDAKVFELSPAKRRQVETARNLEKESSRQY